MAAIKPNVLIIFISRGQHTPVMKAGPHLMVFPQNNSNRAHHKHAAPKDTYRMEKKTNVYH